MTPFFRGYDPSELDEDGEPLPNALGPAIVTLVIVALVFAGLTLGDWILG